MKLKTYIRLLNQLAEDHPPLLELPVITASDDEANNHNEVTYAPDAGVLLDYGEFAITDVDVATHIRLN